VSPFGSACGPSGVAPTTCAPSATGWLLAPAAVWVRRRFPAQLAWLGRRLDPSTPAGLALTGCVVVAAVLAWTFGGLTQDVLAAEGIARLDPGAHACAVAHRTPWLTVIMANVTWLGSNWLLLPILAAATIVLLRRGNRSAVLAVWTGYLGAIVLYILAKPLVHRPRPPAADLIGHASGRSFPSGHATQALAAWGVLAVVLLAGRSRTARTVTLTAATVVVLLVGASRIYLGAHWLTDVLAGYALTAAWLGVLAALALRRHPPVPPGSARTGAVGAGTATLVRPPGSGVPRSSPSAGKA
jgi:membrane-associated phospholipid phosphatase